MSQELLSQNGSEQEEVEVDDGTTVEVIEAGADENDINDVDVVVGSAVLVIRMKLSGFGNVDDAAVDAVTLVVDNDVDALRDDTEELEAEVVVVLKAPRDDKEEDNAALVDTDEVDPTSDNKGAELAVLVATIRFTGTSVVAEAVDAVTLVDDENVDALRVDEDEEEVVEIPSDDKEEEVDAALLDVDEIKGTGEVTELEETLDAVVELTEALIDNFEEVKEEEDAIAELVALLLITEIVALLLIIELAEFVVLPLSPELVALLLIV